MCAGSQFTSSLWHCMPVKLPLPQSKSRVNQLIFSIIPLFWWYLVSSQSPIWSILMDGGSIYSAKRVLNCRSVWAHLAFKYIFWLFTFFPHFDEIMQFGFSKTRNYLFLYLARWPGLPKSLTVERAGNGHFFQSNQQSSSSALAQTLRFYP